MINVSAYAIPGLRRESKKPLFEKTEENIISLVCQVTGISWEKIIGPRGSIKVSNARFLICYFLFNYAGINKSEIAKKINKDHATILNALKKVPDFCETGEFFKGIFDKITQTIES